MNTTAYLFPWHNLGNCITFTPTLSKSPSIGMGVGGFHRAAHSSGGTCQESTVLVGNVGPNQ